jgi:hypothetical protein
MEAKYIDTVLHCPCSIAICNMHWMQSSYSVEEEEDLKELQNYPFRINSQQTVRQREELPRGQYNLYQTASSR